MAHAKKMPSVDAMIGKIEVAMNRAQAGVLVHKRTLDDRKRGVGRETIRVLTSKLSHSQGYVSGMRVAINLLRGEEVDTD